MIDKSTKNHATHKLDNGLIRTIRIVKEINPHPQKIKKNKKIPMMDDCLKVIATWYSPLQNLFPILFDV